MKSNAFKLLLISLFINLFWIVPVQARTYVNNIRHWTAPDHTRIVIDVDKLPKYKLSSEGDPRYLILELEKSRSSLRYSERKIADGLIKSVRIRPKDRRTLGIIIELQVPAKLDIFTLKKYRHKPERVVIDVLRPVKEAFQQKADARVIRAKQKGDRIVLIDPGHGGEDPGAVGRKLRLREKRVALSIAKWLHYMLKKEPGITPYLTRYGDYYLSLGKRTKLAEKYKADMMLSIHANSSKSRKLRGSSVYYLSPKGASDKASQLLAQKENAADLIGGVQMSQDETLNAILIDMMQTTSVNDSIRLGKLALKHLKNVPKVPVDKKLHSAPFAVLKSPSTPSILVETAFVSHPKEERLLANPKFQKRIALQLFSAIKDYLNNTDFEDVPTTTVKKAPNKGKLFHIVKRGETIWRIAKKYGIKLQNLRKANGLGRSNFIRVGQKLHIPGTAR